jgi:hypothetical protein
LFSKIKTKQRLRKFSIGVNYENTNNFKKIFSAGTNPNNSVDGYFCYANGIPLNTFETPSYGLNSGAGLSSIQCFQHNSVSAPSKWYRYKPTDRPFYEDKLSFNPDYTIL